MAVGANLISQWIKKYKWIAWIGLIAILTFLYNNLTIDEVIKLDAFNELKKLGLNDHLSAQRSNGLAAMIKRIKDIANNVEV